MTTSSLHIFTIKRQQYLYLHLYCYTPVKDRKNQPCLSFLNSETPYVTFKIYSKLSPQGHENSAPLQTGTDTLLNAQTISNTSTSPNKARLKVKQLCTSPQVCSHSPSQPHIFTDFIP